MKMKTLAAFALLLPLTTISLTAFAGDEETPNEEKEGQMVVEMPLTLVQNDQQPEEQDDSEPQPKTPELTLSENDANEESEESTTEEKRG